MTRVNPTLSVLAFSAGLILLLPVNSRADTIYVSYAAGSPSSIDKFTADGIRTGLVTNPTSQSDGMVFDGHGNLFVASYYNNEIEMYSPNGVAKLFASIDLNGPGVLNGPFSLAIDKMGNLYASNVGGGTVSSIVQFTPNGHATMFATAGVSEPYSLAFNSQGNLFVANAGNGSIVEFSPTGVGTLFANIHPTPFGLAFDRHGDLYVSTNEGSIFKLLPDGAGSLFATIPGGSLMGLDFDSQDNLYVANQINNSVAKVTRDGIVSVFANTGSNVPVGIVVQHSSIPEPSTFAMAIVGLAFFVIWSLWHWKPVHSRYVRSRNC